MLLNELPISFPQDHLNHQINLQALTVWVDDKSFLLEPNYKKSLIKTSLQINRLTGQIQQVQTDSSFPIKSNKPYHMSLLLGILDICGNKALAFVQQATLVMTIKRRDIFQIKKPRLIYFEKNHKPSQQEYSQIKMFESIFETGLFFSYAYEMTQLVKSLEVNQKREEYYNWCHHIQKPFSHVDKRWRISVIQGYVGKFEIFVKGKKLHFCLMSRRSTKMAGVRFLARGINQQGDTANFIQTEQIILYQNYIFSYVMLRGSLPLFWTHKDEYKGLVKDIVIKKSMQQNRTICLKHLQQISQHGELTIVNLLSQNRSSEAKLIQSFETIMKSLDSKFKYIYYDLNQLSSAEKTKSNFFIQNNLKQIIENQKFFCLYFDQQNEKKEVKEYQKGFFRVNCLDCIERTGMMQAKISALQLVYCLKHIGINLFEKNDDHQLQYFDDTSHPLSYLFNNIWGNNADYLSQQYTGTKSAYSFFYKPSYQLVDKLIQHAMISISRIFIDLGKYDQQKQRSIKALLGYAPQQKQGTSCIDDN